jgi:hypothetical protein
VLGWIAIAVNYLDILIFRKSCRNKIICSNGSEFDIVIDAVVVEIVI